MIRQLSWGHPEDIKPIVESKEGMRSEEPEHKNEWGAHQFEGGWTFDFDVLELRGPIS